MSDFYGIAAGIMGAANVFLTTARRTGRTTRMLEAIKDLDRVVCATRQEADRIRHELKVRKIKAEVLVVAPSEYDRLFHFGTPKGRTHFDHPWVEDYFMNGIATQASRLSHLERELSGYGEAHRETAANAREVARWRDWTA